MDCPSPDVICVLGGGMGQVEVMMEYVPELSFNAGSPFKYPYIFRTTRFSIENRFYWRGEGVEPLLGGNAPKTPID
jgi:hypothetical protein